MTKRFEYEELKCKGRIFECYDVGVRMPDGRVVDRQYLHYNGAVVVLPVLADGSIVMIRNMRFAVQEELLELPAGMLEDGEDPAACAARELAEETGHVAAHVEKLGQFYTGPGTADEVMYSYLATGLTDGRQDLETYEQITVHLYRDDEVRRMVLDGTIHDGKTIATLNYYWLGKEDH